MRLAIGALPLNPVVQHASREPGDRTTQGAHEQAGNRAPRIACDAPTGKRANEGADDRSKQEAEAGVARLSTRIRIIRLAKRTLRDVSGNVPPAGSARAAPGSVTNDVN